MVETMQEELEEMGTAMDSLWLMLGAILVVCKRFHENKTIVRYFVGHARRRLAPHDIHEDRLPNEGFIESFR